MKTAIETAMETIMKKNEILVIYGGNPQQIRPAEMAYKLAEAAGLAGLVGDRNKTIGLKPNLVVSSPASGGATTHPEIAAGIVSYLKANGFANIVILEGSWTGDSTARAFNECGYSELSKKTGVKLVDTQRDTYKKTNCAGMDIEICTSALNIDFMINLPVLKGHCQTLLTCALKNGKGLIPDREKRRFHSIGLHKPIAHLNTILRNDFIVVDGICGDPDFEEGGNPVYAGRIFAARDPVLCDAWAAVQLGYEPADIPYIGIAEKLGIGTADYKKAAVRELSAPFEGNISDTAMRAAPGKVKRLAPYIKEENACSSCFGALVSALLRMDQRELDRLSGAGLLPVSVGQGFAGRKGNTGIGRCTALFSGNCPGCPPSAAEILKFLKRFDNL
ncbi:MAG: DUF362 domain-containing protein [Treponema sp.]|nr:DUF362 domain-containing protein [Treponema sp.]